MTICKQCNASFTRTENRGKKSYCSPECAYKANLIKAKRNNKDAAWYKKYRKEKIILPSNKILMPKSNYNCNGFDWDKINKLTGKSDEYS